MYLFLDTETTGVTPQDRIVSICWAVHDQLGSRVGSAYHVIRPEGFVIPAAASAIHGITTAAALRTGIPLAEALGGLNHEIRVHAPTLYIGHNVAFDRPIVLNEFNRIGLGENLSRLETYCTMRSTTHICRIPRYNGGYKWPTLAELHRHLFGNTSFAAHNAEADVAACAACFFELKSRGMVTL